MQEDILGFEPGGKAIDAAFLALGRYKGKGSGILEVNTQGEVVLGGTHQPGLFMMDLLDQSLSSLFVPSHH